MVNKYTFYQELHNNVAPDIIVPVIMNLIKPESVVDVGCGLGTFLKVFKDNGINDILGIDGPWRNKELLFKNINPDDFIEKDLEQPFQLDRYFDLVICLEVAEHLSEKRADSFIKDLISLGDIILFSAAIPYQGGINHINEKWTEYWETKFEKYGFIKYDILKSFFWDSNRIWWWYKQNMLLYAKPGYHFDKWQKIEYNRLNNVIHPELYESKTRTIDFITTGKGSVYYYLKLLLKGILNKIRAHNN
jgi:SAM-dependent methyltransferase